MKIPMLRSPLVVAMMLAFSGTAVAAGLGRINVFSALGQPLRAEVEITASAEEVDGMVASIASPDAFQRASIEFVPALAGVKMHIEKRGSNLAVVKVSSDKPLSEPFVDMLIELNWAGGRLLREYTFLLDPPATRDDKSASSLAVAPLAQPSREAPPPPERSPATRASRRGGDEYTVKPGDNLSRIAAELKPVEITQTQMLAALYRNNGSAFIEGNIHRLRAGRILKVPETEEVRQIAPAEARRIIVKASNFEQYRQDVASAAKAGPVRGAEAGQAAAGKIEPKVDDAQTQVQPSQDRVKITATQSPQAAGADGRSGSANLAAMQDQFASQAKALQEANSRVADLERNIKDLQTLLELKNQSLALAQRQAAAGVKEPPPGAASGKGSAPAEAVAPKLAQNAASGSIAASSPVPAARPGEPKPAVLASAHKPVDEDNGNPLGVPTTWLGIAAATLGLGYLAVRRRRGASPLESKGLETSAQGPGSAFGNTGGKTVDTGSTSMLNTDFSQASLSAINSEEGVDPVAEADVYMAYGRDAQAEEILLDAMKADPGRAAVYLKLLEIYAERGSRGQFADIATELYAKTGGDGDEWAKASAMGAKLDPENPLYRTPKGVRESGETLIAGAALTAAALAVPGTALSADDDIGDGDAIMASVERDQAAPMEATWVASGDLSQYAIGGEVAPQRPMEQEASAAPEPLNLDFNLDLEWDTGDASEAGATKEQAAEAVELDEPVALASAADDADLPMVQDEKMPPLAFDLDFGADEKPAGNSDDDAGAVATQLAPLTELSTQLLGRYDEAQHAGFDTSSEPHKSLAEMDLGHAQFDGTLLDFDLDLDDTGAGAADAEPAAADAILANSGLSGADDAGLDYGADAGGDDSASTKLELALAYEEMGDMEGARELLDEVMSAGSAPQQKAAREILERIG